MLKDSNIKKNEVVHVPVLLDEVRESFAPLFNNVDSMKNISHFENLDYTKNISQFRNLDSTKDISKFRNIDSMKDNSKFENLDSIKNTLPFAKTKYNEIQDKNTQHDKKTNEIPIIIDCTLGFGSHTKMLLQSFANLRIIGIDRDKDAINYNERLKQEFKGRIIILHGSFAEVLEQILGDLQGFVSEFEIESSKDSNMESKKIKIYGVLADIGVSSYQLDTKERGFSFNAKNLDMRMDTRQNLNAQYILNHYNKSELERVFSEYGEIKEYKKLVTLILQQREALKKQAKGEITPEILHNIALKLHYKKALHPLTLIYQALRIEVNDELGQLKGLLDCVQRHFEALSGAIICIISFHSLEDRIIKERFRAWARSCVCDASVMKCACGGDNARGKIIYKKPLIATSSEIKQNTRARSAKLRAFLVF